MQEPQAGSYEEQGYVEQAEETTELEFSGHIDGHRSIWGSSVGTITIRRSIGVQFWKALTYALRFEFREQFLDLVFLLENRQLLFRVVGDQLRLCPTDCFGVTLLGFHAVEGGHLRSVADGHLGVTGLRQRPGPSMLRDQHVALRFRF